MTQHMHSTRSTSEETSACGTNLPANLKSTLLVSGVALVLFLTLLAFVVRADQPLALDGSVQAWIGNHRSPGFDLFMLLATKLGDIEFTSLVIGFLVLLLFVHRRWWLGLHLAAVFLAARLTVSVIKMLVARTRPLELYDGLQTYSFPSGHTMGAAIVFGALAIILTRLNRSRHQREIRLLPVVVWIATILPVLAVAVSRVYLQAHWPSDTLASLLLVIPFLLAFNWQLRQQPRLNSRWISSPVLLLVPLLLYLVVTTLTMDSSHERYRLSSLRKSCVSHHMADHAFGNRLLTITSIQVDRGHPVKPASPFG